MKLLSGEYHRSSLMGQIDLGHNELTHWGLDKRDTSLQNCYTHFLEWKFGILILISLKFLNVQLVNMAWGQDRTGDKPLLTQCLTQIYMMPYGITKPLPTQCLTQIYMMPYASLNHYRPNVWLRSMVSYGITKPLPTQCLTQIYGVLWHHQAITDPMFDSDLWCPIAITNPMFDSDLWCLMASPSHYRPNVWLRSMVPYGITRGVTIHRCIGESYRNCQRYANRIVSACIDSYDISSSGKNRVQQLHYAWLLHQSNTICRFPYHSYALYESFFRTAMSGTRQTS